MACYIDLLPIGDQQWDDPGKAVHYCRHICSALRTLHLRCCRADLIVRSASIAPGRQDVGITAYVNACGPTPEDARATLASALGRLVDAVLNASAAPKLQ